MSAQPSWRRWALACLAALLVLVAWNAYRVSRPWHNEEPYFGVHVVNLGTKPAQCWWKSASAYPTWNRVLGIPLGTPGAPTGETFAVVPLFGISFDTHDGMNWEGQPLSIRVNLWDARSFEMDTIGISDGHIEVRISPNGEVVGREGRTSIFGWVDWGPARPFRPLDG